MAAQGADQQGRNAADTYYGPAGQFHPEVSNLRSYVEGILDHLKRFNPNSLLRNYLEDSMHDLANFQGKKLQSREETPQTPGLRVQDLILSFVHNIRVLEGSYRPASARRRGLRLQHIAR